MPASTRSTPIRGPLSTLLPALALAFAAVSAPDVASAFGFNDVAQRAAQLATTSYKKPPAKLPDALQALTYDQYRDIRFKPQRAWWRAAKLPFELMFFHEGLYYNEALRIHEIGPDGTREIRFDPSMFDYGANHIDPQGAARPRLRRVSRPLRDQLTQVQGRGDGVSRRELFPRAGQGSALRHLGARASRSTPACCPARNFPASPSSGSSGRRRPRAS